MKKLIASCLILSLLGSTASVCFGSSGGENEVVPPVQQGQQGSENGGENEVVPPGQQGQQKDTGLSTGAKVGIGVGIAAAVTAVVTAVVVPCVIYRDKIKAWFTGPVKEFFTPKKKLAKAK